MHEEVSKVSHFSSIFHSVFCVLNYYFALSGDYFLFGGDTKGCKMFREYPDDLTETGPLNLGRGRFISTISWDVIYNGVAIWAGLTEEENDLNSVLPNRNNFDLFDAESFQIDLYCYILYEMN